MGKPKILFIHGMAAGDWCFKEMIEFFSQRGFDCLALNLPFHSRLDNDKLPGTLSLADYVAYLDDFIKRMGDNKPIVIGHSMGGLLAEIVASRGLAKALVALAPAPAAGFSSFYFGSLIIFGPIIIRPFFWRRPFKFFTFSLNKKTREFFNLFGKESGRVLLEIMFSKEAAKVDHQKITCPAVFINGDKDLFVAPQSVYKQSLSNPSFERKEFSGLGHWLLDDFAGKEVFPFIFDWLKKNNLDK